MTGFEIIILLIIIVAAATILGYYFSYGQPSLKDMEEDIKEEPKEKFQPGKVTQTTTRQLTESAKELIKEIEKVSNTPTTPEESQQLAKDFVDAVTKEKKSKPKSSNDTSKKKKKYYPKKK